VQRPLQRSRRPPSEAAPGNPLRSLRSQAGAATPCLGRQAGARSGRAKEQEDQQYWKDGRGEHERPAALGARGQGASASGAATSGHDASPAGPPGVRGAALPQPHDELRGRFSCAPAADDGSEGADAADVLPGPRHGQHAVRREAAGAATWPVARAAGAPGHASAASTGALPFGPGILLGRSTSSGRGG